MFRIDGPGAVGELPPTRAGVSEPGYFGPGNPATGQMSTRVTYEWLNMMQEEIMSVIEAAGVEADKAQLTQLLTSLRVLFAVPEDIIPPDGITIKIVNGKLQVTFPSRYELGEFYYFRHPTLKPGFQPCMGGVLEHTATLYPEAWAYLQTVEGRKLCKAEAEWQALTRATWATLADGTKVGWNGIGGAPFYAPNTSTGALRMPDLRGMYAEASGFDALGVGGTRGDGIREIMGSLCGVDGGGVGAFVRDSKYTPQVTYGSGLSPVLYTLAASRVVPTAPVNRPRAWGALACCYLGAPR